MPFQTVTPRDLAGLSRQVTDGKIPHPGRIEPLVNVMEVDITKIESAALRRIIEEIRNDEATNTTRAFDRVHVRHNR